MIKKLKIGTRGSALAVTQTEMVCQSLQKKWGGRYEFEIVKIETSGDVLQKTDPNAKVAGGKGIFIKELEESLWRGRVDIAVHSCKDLPVEIDSRFEVVSVPKRFSPFDLLLLKEGVALGAIPDGSLIATGSPRRERQWLDLFPKTEVQAIRGNIDTRIRKVRENSRFIGLILAEAGIKRLQPDTSGFQSIPFTLDQMVPAPGQGALALEICKGQTEAFEVANALNNMEAMLSIRAERAFLEEMGGGCLMPMAAHAKWVGLERLEMHGYYYHNGQSFRATVNGAKDDPESIGRTLARKFLKS